MPNNPLPTPTPPQPMAPPTPKPVVPQTPAAPAAPAAINTGTITPPAPVSPATSSNNSAPRPPLNPVPASKAAPTVPARASAPNEKKSMPSGPRPGKSGQTPARPPAVAGTLPVAPSTKPPNPPSQPVQPPSPKPSSAANIQPAPAAQGVAGVSKPAVVPAPPQPISQISTPTQPQKPPAPGQTLRPQPMPSQPMPPQPTAVAPGAVGQPPRPPQPAPGAMPPAPPTVGRPPAAGAPPVPPSAMPPSPPSQPPQPAPVAAKPKSSIFKFLPLIIGGLVILGVVLFFVMRLLGSSQTANQNGQNPSSTQQTTLTYWGLWEQSAVMEQIFNDFETANPGINIEYQTQSPADYRERLQTAISQGTGPDIFRFHATWVPMLRDDLATVPTTIFTNASFQSTFYPVATQQLQYNGQLRGIPLMYDGLALYYNEDMLKSADAQPPQTWADLRILATKLTVMSGGKVERGGLAIGNATNVEHFSDILGLLMIQNGADLTNPTSPEAREALIFYTDFLKNYQVWSDDLPNSTVAFARGDVAMMFAPSWRAHEIIAQNPNLKFGIAPVPKLGTSQAAWATYWAEGVNSKSRNRDAAWKLLAYMSQPDVMQKMYSQQAGVRRFGELYSRRELATQLVTEPLVAAFLSDAPQAEGWYMSSFTHDNGINDQIIKYYRDAITAVLGGTKPETALQTVTQGVSQVLRQYGVPVSTTTAPATTTTTPGSQLSL